MQLVKRNLEEIEQKFEQISIELDIEETSWYLKYLFSELKDLICNF